MQSSKGKQDPADFTSGLKLPKLETTPLGRGAGDYNAKILAFKNTRKTELPVIEDMDELVTGLFRLPETDQSDRSDVEEQILLKNKVLGLKQRRKNRLDHEVHSRITNAYDKMEVFQKGIKSFDDTLLVAKGRLADSTTGRNSERSSPRDWLKTCAETTNQAASALGELLKMPKGEIHSEVNAPIDPKVKAKRSPTRIDLHAETTEPTEKNRGDERLALHKSKGVLDFQSNVRVMQRRAERQVKPKKENKFESSYIGRGNLTRLMTFDPNQGPTREFTDFLQANGGACGGWEKEDHDVFMKIYMKWKHRPSEVMKLVTKECPARQLHDIASHLRWFEQYQVLNAANKAYVRQWKIDKTLEREQMFKMSKEESKAQLEYEKSRQELIKARRVAAHEREKVTLNEWRKSKKSEVRNVVVEPDAGDGPERTSKLGQNLQKTKDRLVQLLPQAHQVRQVLTKSRLSLGLPTQGGIGSVRSTSSSQEAPAEPGKIPDEANIPPEVPVANPGLVPVRKLTTAEKRLAFYRTRDETITLTKRNAIHRKDSQKIKGVMTSEEIKERISKISLPSQVTQMTKGLQMRQSLRQLEAVEASARLELKKKDQHRHSRVPTPQMFKPGSTLTAIPKLGKPAWRSGNV